MGLTHLNRNLANENKMAGGWRSKLRAGLGHLGLLVTLMLYTAAGGLVFRELESPAELTRLTALSTMVNTERQLLLHRLTHLANSSYSQRTVLSLELSRYEAAVQEAARGGVLVSSIKGTTPEDVARWNTLQAIFFASTVLTTIGYGNIAPVTVHGRAFCLLFALVGIPLTLTVISDLGKMMAAPLPTLSVTRSTPLFSALVALTLLLLYLSIGAALFILWEKDWTFFDGFYFCFITMTTIGFGDLVPSTPQYMLLCTIYILVGLGLTSTIIELVRREYARSWKRLQALAETLSRLGEQGDMSSFQDLKKVLAVLNTKSKQNKDWEDAVKRLVDKINAPKPSQPIIQIIVYESSV